MLNAFTPTLRADDLNRPRLSIPDEPGDVHPTNPASSLPAFSQYCWESFLTLNAAASPTVRGVPDDGRLATPGPDARTAWMTWVSIGDVFPPGGAAPSPWDDGGGARLNNAARPHALSLLSKTPLSDINQPGPSVNTFIGPVIAQNRTYARYEIRFNREAYRHILDKKLYDYHYLPGKGEVPDEFTPGSVVVKASWRLILSGEEGFKSRCFWITAQLRDPFNPSAPPRSADVGLVGLHVILRTPKRNQWIWSSFEHIDNVPDSGQPAAQGQSYSFNYGTAYTGAPPANVDANPPAGTTPGIPQASQSLGPEGPGGPRPTHVVRLQDLHPVTKQVNDRYRQALAELNSVWQHYRLVVTQFPSIPNDINADYDGDPFPGPIGEAEGGQLVSVANSTMETYVQKNTSCMACHQGAKSYGVAFVFSLGRALDRTPPPQEIPAARVIAAARQIAPPPHLAPELCVIAYG